MCIAFLGSSENKKDRDIIEEVIRYVFAAEIALDLLLICINYMGTGGSKSFEVIIVFSLVSTIIVCAYEWKNI